MTRQHCMRLVLSFLALWPASSVVAAYVADFSANGAAADFASFEPNNVDDSSIMVDSGGGDPYLRLTASPMTVTSSQLRFQAAPSNVEGAEVALPAGTVSDPSRSEARLTVTIREISGADELPAEYPFTQFGLTRLNTDTNMPTLAPKVIVQIGNTLDQIFLGRTVTGTGIVSLATFAHPSGVVAGDTFELQVTSDQARLLLNGMPLSASGNEYFNLPANFFSANFAANEGLTPFFGMIRGGSALEPEDVVAIGIDDINARNVTIPEPAIGSLSLAALANVIAHRRRG